MATLAATRSLKRTLRHNSARVARLARHSHAHGACFHIKTLRAWRCAASRGARACLKWPAALARTRAQINLAMKEKSRRVEMVNNEI